MSFYPFSPLSIVPLAIAYVVLAVVFVGLLHLTKSISQRTGVLITTSAIFLVLPVSEELWIAWNFKNACASAGTQIYRKVYVDGFYDDTIHWWRQLNDSAYNFVESKDVDRSLWRVERSVDGLKHFKIENPSAQYWFTRDSGKSISHKIVGQQASVRDARSGEFLAKHFEAGRDGPWFYIGAGKPMLGCRSRREGESSKHGSLIYRDVLLPKGLASDAGK